MSLSKKKKTVAKVDIKIFSSSQNLRDNHEMQSRTAKRSV